MKEQKPRESPRMRNIWDEEEGPLFNKCQLWGHIARNCRICLDHNAPTLFLVGVIMEAYPRTLEKQRLVGNPNEAIIIEGYEANQLLDTGSSVSTISSSLFKSHLGHPNLEPVASILSMECANCDALPFSGYIKATLRISGLGDKVCACPLLVVPDTEYNEATPVHLGTNFITSLQSKRKDLEKSSW
ncbi:retropepsins domain-containing protein [Elysia marginata]|uniref:Retropepsins domain-containing protein n=1 Tax=Elysia marginata TaxID=1093978 RepID=A0AAV4HYQ1_9GAST|nr:retropepsins domain-containing protein [Elysia marginata]